MDYQLIGEILSLVMFLSVIAVLLLGYPVAFSLAGISLLFAGIGYLLGVFDPSNFNSLGQRYVGVMLNEVLVAVPMFIFMGMMLERSGIAEKLLVTMGRLFGQLRGGLGFSVIVVGALLAASTGVVGATVVTMGLLSLPAMLRAGYDPRLASGVICASGTLGQIVPPSTILIFMGDMISTINAQVQMAQGNFAPTTVSVGDIFAGALLPSLMLVSLYLIWMFIKTIKDPESCPALEVSEQERADLWHDVLTSMLPPMLLVVAVLGSILTGIATPTESASVGAVGAMLLAAVRGQLTLQNLRSVMLSTANITSMVFIILLGASVFSLVFRMMGGEDLVNDFLHALPGGKIGAIFFVMVLMFLLGFVLDAIEIIFIVLPITAPVLLMMGVDPIWLGVMVAVNLQTSFMTPPFGFSLFYLRGVAPWSVQTRMIYEGVLPFVCLQLLALVFLALFPALATWLPNLLYSH